MKRKGISVVGILLVIVLIGIAITMAFPMYRSNIIENSRSKVCESNLKILKTSLDLYAADHDVMPGDLSFVPHKYIERAYAQVMRQEGGMSVRLARVVTKWERRGLAHAGLLEKIAGGSIELLTCPSDPTPPEQGGVSYAMNVRLRGMSSFDYANLPADFVLIVDSDHQEFFNTGTISSRHEYSVFSGTRQYANSVTKDGSISRYFQKNRLRSIQQRDSIRTRGSVTESPPSVDK